MVDCEHQWIKVTQTTFDIRTPYLRCPRCGQHQPLPRTPTAKDDAS